MLTVDSSQKQRYTEEEILTEFANHNVKMVRTLFVRISDGAVLGEVLTS